MPSDLMETDMALPEFPEAVDVTSSPQVERKRA